MIICIPKRPLMQPFTILHSKTYTVDLKSGCTMYYDIRITATVTVTLSLESDIKTDKYHVTGAIMYRYREIVNK